jgi:pimeloyl-ACP methyl ester carboxylesterase
MSKRTVFNIVATLIAIVLTFTLSTLTLAQEATPEATDMSETASEIPTPTESGYVSVNGLEMYYAIYGEDTGSTPLVLLHGGLSNIEVDFGGMLPFLMENRRIIGIEQQAHGHTADIDRPMTYEQMADDTSALLTEIGVEQADFLGYSIGGGIALQVAIRHPEQVRKLVLMSASYNNGGLHPGLLAGIAMIQPEMLNGTPYQESYARIAPRPEDFSQMIARIQELDSRVQDWLPQDVAAITAPALIFIGDSDIIRPEHAVDMFRLFGGGVAGDNVGLPDSQLAVLPATTHIGVVQHLNLLSIIIPPFLDAPMPVAS